MNRKPFVQMLLVDRTVDLDNKVVYNVYMHGRDSVTLRSWEEVKELIAKSEVREVEVEGITNVVQTLQPYERIVP